MYKEILEEQAAAQAERVSMESEQAMSDARWLLKSQRGRRFIYNQFNLSYLPFEPMTDDPRRTAYVLGLQAACARMTDLLSRADTKNYHRMMVEGSLEKESNNG